MILPMVIGKNSAGEDVLLDVGVMPLLMISYCNEDQLGMIFKQLNRGDQTEKHFLMTNSRRFYQWGFRKNGFLTFLRDMPSFDISSRAKFLRQVMQEINRRQQLIKSDHTIIFNQRFLFIDDIWDVITSKPKKNALDLMMIMLYGPEVGIRTIFASIMSYMNLLQQLVHLHPQLSVELQKRYGTPEPRLIGEVGHELIFSMEDFVYYKKGIAHPIERYYKMSV